MLKVADLAVDLHLDNVREFMREMHSVALDAARKEKIRLQAEVDSAGLRRSADRAGMLAGRTAGGSFSSSFGRTMRTAGKLAGGVALAAGAGIGILGKIGLEVAAQNEQAQISFETMLGSASRARVFLEDLKQFAADTPFAFPELQTASASLISAGFEAKKVIPIMTTLGDVTSGMGTGSEGIKRATVALQQMSAAGRITGEDLNQLRDAGVPVFDLLSAATGKTKEEIAGLAQAGKLGKSEMNALFEALESGKGLERFNGLMEKQSQSLTGIISTIKDQVGQGLAEAITPYLPAIKSALVSGAEALGQFFEFMSEHQAAITNFFLELAKGTLQFGTTTAQVVGFVLTAYSKLQSGMIPVVDFILSVPEAILSGLSKIPNFLLPPGWGSQIDKARDNVAGLRDTVVDGMTKARDKTAEYAEKVGDDLVGKLKNANVELEQFQAKAVLKAKAADAVARFGNNVAHLSEDVSGNNIQLEKWSDRTRLSRMDQEKLAGSIKEARNRLRDVIDASKAAGDSQAVLTEKWRAGRNALFDEFVQMGLSKKEARRLAAEYADIPHKVETTITQPGMAAARSNLSALASQLLAIDGMTVSPSVIIGTANRLNVQGRAAGGAVSGPGGPRDDLVPAMLSDGEYVINAASAKRVGYDTLDQINRYASGGIVTGAGKKSLAALKRLGFKIAGNRATPKKDILESGIDAPPLGDALYNLLTRNHWVDKDGTLFAKPSIGLREFRNAAQYNRRAQARETAKELAAEAKELAAARATALSEFSFSLTGDTFSGGIGESIRPGADFRSIIGGVVEQAQGLLEIGAITKQAYDNLRGAAAGYLDRLNAVQTALDAVNEQITVQEGVLADAITKLDEARRAYDEFTSSVRDSITALGAFASMDNGIQRTADATAALAEAQDVYNATLAKYGTSSPNTVEARRRLDAARGNAASAVLTGGEITANVRAAIAKARAFVADVTALRNMGLSESALREIIAMGPIQGAPYAAALRSSGLDNITALNAARTELASIGSEFGVSAASWFGLDAAVRSAEAGVAVAQGILAGLQSQRAALEAEMASLGNAMAAAFKSALGIASPSRVFMEAGVNILAGLQRGLTSQVPNTIGMIDGLASRMAPAAGTAAIPSAGISRAGVHIEHVSVAERVSLDTLVQRLDYWTRTSGGLR